MATSGGTIYGPIILKTSQLKRGQGFKVAGQMSKFLKVVSPALAHLRLLRAVVGFTAFWPLPGS